MQLSILQTFLLSMFIAFMAVETYWWGGAIYIARPVFAGPLIGLIMGDFQTGLIVGGSVEMVFMGGLAMGAYSPPNSYIGGMVGTALAITSGSIELGIALAYPIGVLVQFLNYVATNLNVVFVERGEKLIHEGKVKEAEVWHWMCIIVSRMLLQYFLPTFVAIWLGSTVVQNFYDSIPAWVTQGMSIAAGILPAIGMAAIISTLGVRKGWPFFLAGFVLSAYLKMDVMSIALLAVVIAVVMATRGENTGFSFDTSKVTSGVLDNKDFRRVFFRSFTSMGSMNYKGYNNFGYLYSIRPALEKIYKDDPEGYQEALDRNCEFFNSHPYFSNLIMGVSLALEEQKANGADVDGAAITATKAALMGPLAGIGDSVFQGTFLTIFKAIGAGMLLQSAESGVATGVVGMFVYLIPQILLSWGSRWGFLKYAYKYGTELVIKLRQSNLFDKFVEGANVVGMMVIAAMTSSFVNISIKYVVNLTSEGTDLAKEIPIQGIFDAILPKFLPLMTVILFYKIMQKNQKSGIYWCLIGSFVVGFIGAITGIL